MTSPQYLLRSPSGVWTFRIAVPRQLRELIGSRELKRSLGTTDRHLAVSLAGVLAYRAQQFFQGVRPMHVRTHDEPRLGMFISSLSWAPSGAIEMRDVQLDPANPEGELKLLQGLQVSLGMAPRGNPDTLPLLSPTASTGAPEATLGGVIGSYCDEHERSAWTPKTAAENRAIYRVLLEVLGDIPCCTLTGKEARAFKAALGQLPSNYRKKPQYRDKPLAEILATAKSDTLSVRTVNKYLTRAASLMDWAVRHGHLGSNPFHKLGVKTKIRPHEDRDTFATSDLQALFSSPVFTSHDFKHPYCFWLPLIAPHTGMRLEEICQLDVANIREVDGVWVFDVNTEDGRRLKSPSSQRLIPIHPRLRELGFLTFVEERKADGTPRLFPELKKQRDGYGMAASKWFARYRAKQGIFNPKQTFHSFRHTVANCLKQEGIPNAQVSALLGHIQGSMAFDRYGKPFTPKALEPVVATLDFSEALKEVKPWTC